MTTGLTSASATTQQHHQPPRGSSQTLPSNRGAGQYASLQNVATTTDRVVGGRGTPSRGSGSGGGAPQTPVGERKISGGGATTTVSANQRVDHTIPHRYTLSNISTNQ